MKAILIFMFLVVSVQAFATCRTERTIGADRGGARYNCEGILRGEAGQCFRSGSLWTCECFVDCKPTNPGERYTRTTGASLGGARQNCEIILRGYVERCARAGTMWTCGCYY